MPASDTGGFVPPLDIAFVITGLSLGGAEVQVTELAIRHRELGRKVGVISMVSNGDVLIDRLRDAGVSIVQLGMPRGRPSIGGILKAIRTLRAWRPSVVHGHMYHANLLVRVLRPFLRDSVIVCTAHNSNEGGRARMLAYRLTHRLGDVLTNVSEVAARELERRGAAPSGSVRVVWNAVDTVRFRPNARSRAALRQELGLQDSAFLFLAVGRLVPQKDYFTLLRAIAEVCRRRSGVALLVVGEGEMRRELESFSRNLGLVDEVLWMGERRDVERFMAAADAFVLSSAFEGFGMVVAEAMVCELPVVATRCCGPEEVLGDCGYLVPVADPAALAESMLALISEEPECKHRRVVMARRRALEKFSIEAAMISWERLYSSVGVAKFREGMK